MNVTVETLARTFGQSRRRFLAAVRQAGDQVEAFAHPLRGPDGEALFTDVARIGPAAASRVLVLVSGVHGVEHYAGSGCLAAWLESGDHARLPAETAVVLIHAINPWGAAHCRRYTEENIDLARNFRDFSQAPPVNSAYETVHEVISSDRREIVQAGFAELIGRLGERNTIEALMSGQFVHPEGFSYGGNAECRSHRLLLEVLARHAKDATSIGIIE